MEQLTSFVTLLRAQQQSFTNEYIQSLKLQHQQLMQNAIMENTREKDKEVSRLLTALKEQSEQFELMKLKLEEQQKEEMKKISHNANDKLSQVKIEESLKHEQEVAKLNAEKRKQAEEFSLARIKMDEQQEKKIIEIEKEQKKHQSSILGKLMPGEEQAMRDNTYRELSIKLNRVSQFGNIEEYHYRYAESEFLRLPWSNPYYVTEVKYIVNPTLIRAFMAKQQEFEKAKSGDRYVLCCHPSSAGNIDRVARANFTIDNNGLTFSNFQELSKSALNSEKRILLCKVLIGTNSIDEPIYDNSQILPCYVVHFTEGRAQIMI